MVGWGSRVSGSGARRRVGGCKTLTACGLRVLLVYGGLLGGLATTPIGRALAQPAEADPTRFAEEIDAFAEWDGKNTVGDGILLVGSSSIRRWATAAAFADLPIINRGFGGAQISDLLYYYERVVGPYAPSTVVFYAGDNDIGVGKTPERVLADFAAFADRLHADFPRARLLFLAIKPSLLRWARWEQMQQANRLIRDYIEQHPEIVYVDVATPLLDADGMPKPVFVEDGLHLNAEGYEIWRSVLAPYLRYEWAVARR